MLKQRAYDYNVCVLKKYNENKYKLTRHSVLRNKGVEMDNQLKSERCSVNDNKLRESLVRARSRIYEYGICNDWDFFVTLTIDKNKFDRYDLKNYYSKFSQFLRNYNKRHNLNIKYLFIPEKHKDGAWHMHGFLHGLPINHLEVNHHGYYDWIPYSSKFGYISLDMIRDKDKASSYITKYISKNLVDCVTELNSKMYYCSNGLKKAEVIKKGSISANIEPSFSNEYVEIKYFDNATLALSYFDD